MQFPRLAQQGPKFHFLRPRLAVQVPSKFQFPRPRPVPKFKFPRPTLAQKSVLSITKVFPQTVRSKSYSCAHPHPHPPENSGCKKSLFGLRAAALLESASRFMNRACNLEFYQHSTDVDLTPSSLSHFFLSYGTQCILDRIIDRVSDRVFDKVFNRRIHNLSSRPRIQRQPTKQFSAVLENIRRRGILRKVLFVKAVIYCLLVMYCTMTTQTSVNREP